MLYPCAGGKKVIKLWNYMTIWDLVTCSVQNYCFYLFISLTCLWYWKILLHKVNSKSIDIKDKWHNCNFCTFIVFRTNNKKFIFSCFPYNIKELRLKKLTKASKSFRVLTYNFEVRSNNFGVRSNNLKLRLNLCNTYKCYPKELRLMQIEE